MATSVSTILQLYEILKAEIESRDGDYSDFNEGSMLDILSGAFSTGLNEISELTVAEFKKTYFETAHGPEVTGGNDDLETLAKDHYGDDFSRPKATKSTGSVTFSRASAGSGDVAIASGTVVKTEKDVSGQEVRFVTTESVLMTGLTIDANVEAVDEGSDGNVDAAKILVIETTLTDSSVTVNNSAKMAGGIDEEDDAEYRETIRNKIQSLAGAIKEAIEGAVLSVSGVSIVSLIERERVVIDYNVGSDEIESGAVFFRIPYPVAYIADSNGNSSQSLIDEVTAALEPVRACGVQIEVLGAIAVNLDWNASLTLNAGGPNFATLQSDISMITDSMKEYLTSLEIGEDFIKTAANEYILSIWGPDGTNDLVAFNTNSPVANTSIDDNQKIIAGTMSIT